VSYSNLRKQTQAAAAMPDGPTGPAKCAANGCPCVASVQAEGGRWCCTSHAFALSDLWPQITEGMRDHEWLVQFIGEVQKMDRTNKNWRSFASQFWAGQDEFCIPHPKENAIPYFNRMKGELDCRLGLCKRPAVRLPQEPRGRGNAANFLRRRAA
jgi:hypothetical protein